MTKPSTITLLEGDDSVDTPASGKLALYTKTDNLLYKKDSTGTETAIGVQTSPGGSSGQVQFNNSGSFGGSSEFAYASGSGNTFLTVGGSTLKSFGTSELDIQAAGNIFSVVNGSGYNRIYLDATGSGLLSFVVAGGGIAIPQGTNGLAGRVTLVAGTATVPCAAVTADSVVLLTPGPGDAPLGRLQVTSQASSQFIITSTDSSDTCTVGYFVVLKPA